MTLRARLTLGLVIVATVGLVTTDVVSYTWLRSFLVGRVDESLTIAFHSLTTALPVAPSAAAITTYQGGILPGHCVQVRQLDDEVTSARCLPEFQETSAPPPPRHSRRARSPGDRKSTRLNSSHVSLSRMPSSA